MWQQRQLLSYAKIIVVASDSDAHKLTQTHIYLRKFIGLCAVKSNILLQYEI